MQPEPPPAFFIPDVAEADQERVYALLAGGYPPEPGKRIYSITFRHNGETWTATVGEKLAGTKIHKRTSRGKKIEREVSISNGSKVVAIFPGIPYLVFHDGASRHWANPFYADAKWISYFSK